MSIRDEIRFLTEPRDSEDFDKDLDDWKAAKGISGELRPGRIHFGLAIIAAAILVLIMLTVTGCGSPCDGHGGINRYVGNSIYVCNDGTWV